MARAPMVFESISIALCAGALASAERPARQSTSACRYQVSAHVGSALTASRAQSSAISWLPRMLCTGAQLIRICGTIEVFSSDVREAASTIGKSIITSRW